MKMYDLSRSLTTLFLLLGLAATPQLHAQSAQVVPEIATDTEAIEITATDYAFRAPTRIPSGWTNLHFKNEGEEVHFVFLARLPEGKTIDHYEMELGEPFSEVWQGILNGELTQEEAGAKVGEVLPEWYANLEFVGGPGLMTPTRTSETTLYLEPGNYVLECYMKTEDGKIHAMEGMLRPLTVTEETSGVSSPHDDIQITLSNSEMTVEGALTPGTHTFAVHAAENPEQGFGHSAHLARLNSEATLDDLVQWMNWFGLAGLRSPAPAEFLGGAHMMPTGNTTYFSAHLTPGRYVVISEATAHQGMLQEFTVAR